MDDPNDPKNWSPLHRYFEAYRGIKKLLTGPHETIPEALVRTVLAQQYGVKPEEVTWKQIKFEISGLLPYYPAITLVPSEPAAPPQTLEEAFPSNPEFPNRADWLRARLKERNWGQADINRQSGPDRKTIRRILNGERVREDVLDRLAKALSRKYRTVDITDIPSD
jgi:Cro/C1-type HTH DNA-binding domain